MEINATGFAAKELVPNRNNVEQDLTQKAQENTEAIQQPQKALQPRPVEQVSPDRQGRIDIYA